MAGPPSAPRFEVPLLVCLDDGVEPWGFFQNVSTSGALVHATTQPPIGSIHNLRFVWDVKKQSCLARIVRHTENGVAVQFVDPTDEVLRTLRRVIDVSPAVPGRGPEYIDGFYNRT